MQAGFKEVQRELVFDIDISDYDDVRKCCQGAKVCSRCWPLMEIAVRVLKRILNMDFGWTKLLFGMGLELLIRLTYPPSHTEL